MLDIRIAAYKNIILQDVTNYLLSTELLYTILALFVNIEIDIECIYRAKNYYIICGKSSTFHPKTHKNHRSNLCYHIAT